VQQHARGGARGGEDLGQPAGARTTVGEVARQPGQDALLTGARAHPMTVAGPEATRPCAPRGLDLEGQQDPVAARQQVDLPGRGAQAPAEEAPSVTPQGRRRQALSQLPQLAVVGAGEAGEQRRAGRERQAPQGARERRP